MSRAGGSSNGGGVLLSQSVTFPAGGYRLLFDLNWQTVRGSYVYIYLCRDTACNNTIFSQQFPNGNPVELDHETATVNGNVALTALVQCGQGTQGCTAAVSIDNLRVRKYASPEPTASSAGVVEMKPCN